VIADVVTVVGGGVVRTGLTKGVGVGAGSPVTVIAEVVMVVGGVGLTATVGGRTTALGGAVGSAANARAPDPSAARNSMVGMPTFGDRIKSRMSQPQYGYLLRLRAGFGPSQNQ
jgi:hypothetical protein